MELNRRRFLQGMGIVTGGALALKAAGLVGGLAVQDAVQEAVGRVYSFPKVIKLASSYADSKYFVMVEELENEYHANDHTLFRLRREYYDAAEFWARPNPYQLPVKVEYVPVFHNQQRYVYDVGQEKAFAELNEMMTLDKEPLKIWMPDEN